MLHESIRTQNYTTRTNLNIGTKLERSVTAAPFTIGHGDTAFGGSLSIGSGPYDIHTKIQRKIVARVTAEDKPC